MEPAGARSGVAGIWLTQDGEALAHGLERARNCARAVSCATPLGASVADAQAIDKEVAEAGFRRRDGRQVGLMPVLEAEGGPSGEFSTLRGSGAGDNGVSGGTKRSAEVRAESISGLRASGSQGSVCGCACDM
jgi:hypothetical protein